jgi:hypothetical protein
MADNVKEKERSSVPVTSETCCCVTDPCGCCYVGDACGCVVDACGCGYYVDPCCC